MAGQVRKPDLKVYGEERDPQTVVVLVGDIGLLPPDLWRDSSGLSWTLNLPVNVIPKPTYFSFSHGPYDLESFRWNTYLGLGKELLQRLSEKLEEHKARRPVLFVAQAFGGIIVKQALRAAYEDPSLHRSLLSSLAGAVLFATPHASTDNRQFWQNINYAFQGLFSSRKRRSISAQDCGLLTYACLGFEQARVLAPILSIYETEATKIRMSSIAPTKAIHLIGPEHVRTNVTNEEVLNMHGDHKVVGSASLSVDVFKRLCSSIETFLEDARLDLADSSTNYEALSIIDHQDEMGSIELQTNTSHFANSAKESGVQSKTLTEATSFPTRSGSSADFEPVPQISVTGNQHVGPKLPYHSIPFAHNRDFSGRESEMRAIESAFFESDDSPSRSTREEPKTFAICGPGGMGKTQLATEFCYSHKHRFDAICWVRADEESQLGASFGHIAVDLGLVAEDSVDARDQVVTRELLKGWLANPTKDHDPSDEAIAKHAKWLLVFDCVDDLEVLRDTWPLDGPGCILFTSRDSMAKVPGVLAEKGLDLPALNPGEASRLLQKLTRRKSDGHTVAKRLGCYPLAISQMAGVIIRQGLSFEEFLETYEEEEGREELLSMRLEPLARPSLCPHSLASVLALEHLNHGRPLLHILSMLNADSISEAILVRGVKTIRTEGFPRTMAAYRKARTELLQSSLVSRSQDQSSIVVHRLIQDTARSKMPLSVRLRAFLDTVGLISGSWPWEELSSFRHKVLRWRACNSLLPHIFRLKSIASQFSYTEEVFDDALTFARLMTDAGWYSHESGNFHDATELFDLGQNTIQNLESILASAAVTSQRSTRLKRLEKVLAELHHNIGCTSTETNEPAAALNHFQIFNQLMKREVETHPTKTDQRLAISWNELGNAYMMNSSWDEAKTCYLNSIAAFNEMPESDKTNLSLPSINLALSHWLSNRYEEAQSILTEVLKTRELAFGKDDTESFITGRALHALGNVAFSLRDVDVSFDYHRRALDQYKSVLGKHHHRTGDAHVKMAEHFLRLREYHHALEHSEESIRVFSGRTIYKPERARAHFKKGQALQALDQMEEAEKNLHEGCKLYNEVTTLGKKAPEHLSSKDLDAIIVFWSR